MSLTSLPTTSWASSWNTPSVCSAGVSACAVKTEITIPIRLAAPSEGDAMRAAIKSEPSPLTESIRGGALLVISDDHVLKAGLRLGGADGLFRVEIASSLREVEEKANHTKLAAGWVDLDLPGRAGWDVAEWLLSQKPTVRLLMLTAHQERHEISAALQAGVVFEKASGAAGLLRATTAILAEPAPQAEERFALQQAWLRRAMPYRWDAASVQSYQHWGINE